MEDALRDGLRGRGPAPTAVTWAAPEDETAATQMLSGTSATTALPARRRMQPIDEPTPAPVARRPPPARRSPSAPPPAARPRRGSARPWIALLVILALIAGGVAAYQASGGGPTKQVQLREDVGGDANEAIDQLRGLIQDNTR